MAIGPAIRRLFGPYERHASAAYRAMFFDIDDFVARTRQWRPKARRILEVGCGEGAVTERLRRTYPEASITGIDITPKVGRLYSSSRADVTFLQCDVATLAHERPATFDLVVLCDVLHHVPLPYRRGLLDAIRVALAPDGSFIFKDWQRNSSAIYWIGYAADRWITGDRIEYMTREEMRRHVTASFGECAVRDEALCRPWGTNLMMLIRP